MKIRTLTLTNFRGFESATVDLDRPLTVLFGVNGSGKSSVLAGCAAAVSDAMVSSLYGEAGFQLVLEETDIRRGATMFEVTASVSNGEQTGDVGVTYVSLSTTGNRISSFVAPNLRGAPVLVVFYDSMRQVTRAAEAFVPNAADLTPLRPASATHDALAVGHLKFRSLFQWFKAREDVENERKVAEQNLSLEDPQLTVVRRAIAGMLPGFSGLRIQRDPLHMVVRKGDEALLIDQLSDGEKLLLTLTADLARRLAMTYADHGDPLHGEAIVLIDEIELHLHPAWQRRVLADLRRTFPGCQFIVTTHSPQVLSEVPNDAVIQVKDFQFFRPAAPTEGRDSNAILWEVLEVPAHPRAIIDRLGAITELLDEGKQGEARKQLDRLAQALTERDPEVARLRGLLDVMERLDASDHEGA
jgi:predicted ATP-binding protein involved in virulence